MFSVYHIREAHFIGRSKCEIKPDKIYISDFSAKLATFDYEFADGP